MGRGPEQLKQIPDQPISLTRKDLSSANFYALGVTVEGDNPNGCAASQYNNLTGDFADLLYLDENQELTSISWETYKEPAISTFDCERCNVHEIWQHRGKPVQSQECSEDADRVFLGIKEIYDSGRCLANPQKKETDGLNP